MESNQVDSTWKRLLFFFPFCAILGQNTTRRSKRHSRSVISMDWNQLSVVVKRYFVHKLQQNVRVTLYVCPSVHELKRCFYFNQTWGVWTTTWVQNFGTFATAANQCVIFWCCCPELDVAHLFSLVSFPYRTTRASEGPVFSGVCKWFSRSKGHGFIVPADGGSEIFVHISE